MAYELRYRVGDEVVKSGLQRLSGDLDSALAQAKALAQTLVFSDNNLSEFFLRGPKGLIIPIEVTRKTIPG